MKKSAVFRTARIVGAVIAALVAASAIIAPIADNVFVTHAAAKMQHDDLQMQIDDRMKLVEEREDLHYREMSNRLEKIDNSVTGIYNLLLSERKK